MAGLGEFELIARFFTRDTSACDQLRQGIGDDCAILQAGECDWAVTSDLLIEGMHFFLGADPYWLGHKALAVNLSDLAAAGAQPFCFFLALGLPQAQPAWLEAFSKGLFALADTHGCVLAGGDTTRSPSLAGRAGPLTIGITAMGRLPAAAALSRGGARMADDIWLSGSVGAAALALRARQGAAALAEPDALLCARRLDAPQPRVALGQALRGLAHAAIDVSDGVLADLGHVCERSGLGASVQWAAVPRAEALASQPLALQYECALAGGDDYELLFTAAPAQRAAIEAAAARANTPVTRIGSMTKGSELCVLDAQGKPLALSRRGFDHFRD